MLYILLFLLVVAIYVEKRWYMTKETLIKHFPLELPIFYDNEFWNGEPDEFSNIGFNLNYSQKYGMTPYAKTGVYGIYKGKTRPHNGHDFAGNRKTPLALPRKAWVSFIGYDKYGYGNFCFFETEAITENGDTVKMEYVLAHMNNSPIIKLNRWHEKGTLVGHMGNSGMSTGLHTHFAGRPLLRKQDGSWEYLFKDDLTLSARSYIDLEEFFINKPVYDKQILINRKKFMQINDRKLIFNNKTGEIGWLYGGKLRVPEKARLSEMLASYLANKEGVNISQEEWEVLEKEKF